MKRGFLDLLDPSNDPEFFWQVISGPPCIFLNVFYLHYHHGKRTLNLIREYWDTCILVCLDQKLILMRQQKTLYCALGT
jgi:hypothetical protein